MNGSEEQQHRHPEDCPGFLRIILRERGCLVTLVVALLLSLGIGSVIGLVCSLETVCRGLVALLHQVEPSSFSA